KSGDDTRSLIGMIRTNASSQFSNTGATTFVLSWFNRRRVTSRITGTTALAVTSATAIEFSSAFRAQFLSWAGDMPDLRFNGNAYVNAASSSIALELRYDTTSFNCYTSGVSFASGFPLTVGLAGHPTGLAEGYHQAMIYGASPGGFTITINDATS